MENTTQPTITPKGALVSRLRFPLYLFVWMLAMGALGHAQTSKTNYRTIVVTQSVTNNHGTIHLVLYTTDKAPRVRMAVSCGADARELSLCRSAQAGERGIEWPAKDDALYQGQNVCINFDGDGTTTNVYALQDSSVE
jgi:hypothetical protein